MKSVAVSVLVAALVAQARGTSLRQAARDAMLQSAQVAPGAPDTQTGYLQLQNNPSLFLSCGYSACSYTTDKSQASAFVLPNYDPQDQGEIGLANADKSNQCLNLWQGSSSYGNGVSVWPCGDLGAEYWQFNPSTGQVGYNWMTVCLSAQTNAQVVWCSGTNYAKFQLYVEPPGYLSGSWVPLGSGGPLTETFAYTQTTTTSTSQSWSDTVSVTANVGVQFEVVSASLSSTYSQTYQSLYSQTLSKAESTTCQMTFTAGNRWQWQYTHYSSDGQLIQTVTGCDYTQNVKETCCALMGFNPATNKCYQPGQALTCATV